MSISDGHSVGVFGLLSAAIKQTSLIKGQAGRCERGKGECGKGLYSVHAVTGQIDGFLGEELEGKEYCGQFSKLHRVSVACRGHVICQGLVG